MRIDAWPVDEREEWPPGVDPAAIGHLLVYVDGVGDLVVRTAMLANATNDVRERFAEWAAKRVGRLCESGPDVDGWQDCSAGLQVWACERQLPYLD